MGFVFEELSKDKGQELCEKYHLTLPLGSNPPVVPTKWAVDKTANAFLTSLGGDGRYGDDSGIPNFLVFVWNDQQVFIKRFEDYQPSQEKQVIWYVQHIAAPASLVDNEEELNGLIKEALLAYGSGGGKLREDATEFKQYAKVSFFNDASW